MPCLSLQEKILLNSGQGIDYTIPREMSDDIRYSDIPHVLWNERIRHFFRDISSSRVSVNETIYCHVIVY